MKYIGESGRLLFLPSSDPKYLLDGELFTVDDEMKIVDDGKLSGKAFYNSEVKVAFYQLWVSSAQLCVPRKFYVCIFSGKDCYD